jgi:hypothetical protein
MLRTLEHEIPTQMREANERSPSFGNGNACEGHDRRFYRVRKRLLFHRSSFLPKHSWRRSGNNSRIGRFRAVLYKFESVHYTF